MWAAWDVRATAWDVGRRGIWVGRMGCGWAGYGAEAEGCLVPGPGGYFISGGPRERGLPPVPAEEALKKR
jgi:hypothetical protein